MTDFTRRVGTLPMNRLGHQLLALSLHLGGCLGFALAFAVASGTSFSLKIFLMALTSSLVIFALSLDEQRVGTIVRALAGVGVFGILAFLLGL